MKVIQILVNRDLLTGALDVNKKSLINVHPVQRRGIGVLKKSKKNQKK
jgi:hypothetical protein